MQELFAYFDLKCFSAVLLYYPAKDLVHVFPVVAPSKAESREVHRKVIAFFDQYVG